MINSWEHFAYDSRKHYNKEDEAEIKERIREMREDYKIDLPPSMPIKGIWDSIKITKPMLAYALEYNCLLEIYHIKQKGEKK
jgi:hypothetical protein